MIIDIGSRETTIKFSAIAFERETRLKPFSDISTLNSISRKRCIVGAYHHSFTEFRAIRIISIAVVELTQVSLQPLDRWNMMNSLYMVKHRNEADANEIAWQQSEQVIWHPKHYCEVMVLDLYQAQQNLSVQID